MTAPSALAAQRRLQMDGILVRHPRLETIHESFDLLMEHARNANGGDTLCMPMIAPSQSGKSTIIRSFAAAKNTPEKLAEREIPVLHVTLDANITRKGLAQNILEAISTFGYETGYQRGSETLLLQRVRTYLKAAETRLLVIDEFHHVLRSDNQLVAYVPADEKKLVAAHSVGETVKRFLIGGNTGVVISGIEAAWDPFKANKQLVQRSLPKADLSALDVDDNDDVAIFNKFLASYLVEVERRGIAKNAKSLLQDRPAECIAEVTGGVLGSICNLIKGAVVEMTLDGRDELTTADLAAATDSGFVRMGLRSRNPFSEGLSDRRAGK
ncbi:MAG: TniB family NTP-binding protein [Alphaproteobacteria bacterium]|nr:TniB family NTP-binding protein [Alphaproteobacteria bacterium]MBU1526099.1 TniB family NTP-binding protein [Alphaproteobacteria bacterium]MBU2118685.1 TniB family NTP-binding protein [Alphaproteobacteria bacterium]MBU2350588.1 TniB family NTP-binding protein [Alphaproteobacteria bacterium]